MEQQGGCLCGALRYGVATAPDWVTICHCRFCQRATGAAYMIEPIFEIGAFRLTAGDAARYTHVSEGSGKGVHIHFCATCGTKTHLTFARWPDRLGVYSGTFDDPGWFEVSPATAKIIFIDAARPGTLIPPGFRTFREHAATARDVPLDPVVLSEVLHIR